MEPPEPRRRGARFPAAQDAHLHKARKMAPRDTETVIVDGGRGGGSAAGLIAGIVIALLVIGGLIWYFNGHAGTGGTVDVDVPAVSINVTPDGQ